METRVGDVRLFFDVDGAKLRPDGPELVPVPTVVVVHDGPGADHTTYKHPAFGPEVAKVAQVVYYDQRGHGRSEQSHPSWWTLDVWADDVRALCEALAIERPVVFGSGFGALVAVRYAARHPDHPARLVLSRPVARWNAASSVATAERIAGEELAEELRRFYASPSDETFARYTIATMRLFREFDPAEVADAMLRARWNFPAGVHWFQGEAFTFDLREDAAQITVPTLVLAGEDDPLMPVEGAQELVDGIDPRLVTFHRYPGVRHALYAAEPRALAETLAFVTAAAPVPAA